MSSSLLEHVTDTLKGEFVPDSGTQNISSEIETGETDSDFYDYDLDESFSSFDWVELGPSLSVYSITFLSGIVGNILILVAVIRHTHVKNSPVNVFLASLALADLLLILICLPLKVAKLFSYSWTMGVLSCKMLYYLQSVSSICSVLNLTALSIERYYAIVHPLKAQYLCTISKAKKTVLGTWTSAFILATPILWVQVHKEVGARFKAFWCVRDFDSLLWWRLGELYLLFVVLVFPAIVMIFSYGRIIFEVCRVFRQRERMTNGAARGSAAQRTAPLQVSNRGAGRFGKKSKFMNDKKANGNLRNRDLEMDLETSCMVPLTTPVMTVTNANGVYEIALEAETCVMLQQQQKQIQQKQQQLLQQQLGEEPGERPKDPMTQSPIQKPVLLPKQPQEAVSRGVSPCPSHEDAAKLNVDVRKEGKKLDEETKQVVRMLISIVILFIFCWAPLLIFNVLQSFGIIDTYLIGKIKYAKTTFSLMAYFNSCINPLVYGFMSKNFRESFLSDIRACCRLGRGRRGRSPRERRNSRCFPTSANSLHASAAALSTVRKVRGKDSNLTTRDSLLPMTSCRNKSPSVTTMMCDDGATGVSLISSVSICQKTKKKGFGKKEEGSSKLR